MDTMYKGLIICFVWATIVSAGDVELEFDLDTKGDALPTALLKVAEGAYQSNLRGLKELDQGNYAAALALFHAASNQLPNYSDADNNCAVVYFRQGNYVQARSIWNKIINYDKRYFTAFYNLGTLAFVQNDLSLAQFYVDKALKINKRFVNGIVLAGKIAYSNGNNTRAIKLLNDALSLDKKNVEARHNLAYIYAKEKKYNEALSILKPLKNDVYALRLQGFISTSFKKYDDAVEAFQQAYSIDNDKNILWDIAQVYYESEQYEKAFITAKRYILRTKQPTEDVWLLVSSSAKESGNLTEAIDYSNEGLKRYPTNNDLLINGGQLYFTQEKYNDAYTLWQKVSTQVKDPEFLYLHALTSHKINKSSEAETLIKEAISIDRKSEYLNFYGILLHAQGKKDEAISMIKEAAKSGGTGTQEASLNLALLTKERGNSQKEIKKLEKKIRGCADCIVDKLRLSLLFHYNGETKKSISLLEKIENKENRVYQHLVTFYKNQSQWEKAITTLENGLGEGILKDEEQLTLAELYLHTGSYLKAVTLLEKLRNDRKSKPKWRIYYQLGYAQMKLKDYEEAEKNLVESRKLKKDYAPSLGVLGFVKKELGHHEEAKKYWKESISLSSDNDVMWVNMGLASEESGEFKKALEYYEKAISLTNDNSIKVNIGNVYKKMGNETKALSAYESALHSKEKINAAYNAFTVYIKQKKYSQSKKMVDILKEDKEQKDLFYKAQGEYLISKGDTLSALHSLEKILIREDADNYLLALAYIHKKELDKAEDVVNSFSTNGELEQQKRQLKGKIAFLRGDYENAMTHWEGSKSSDYISLYNNTLTAYKGKKFQLATKKAEQIFFMAIEDNDKKNLLIILTNGYIQQKKWTEAIKWLEKSISLYPKDSKGLYNLSVAYYNTNDMNKSYEFYKKAQKINPTLQNNDIEKRYAQLKKKSIKVEKVVQSELETLYNKAVSYQEKKNYKKALKFYKEIVKKDKTFYQAWNNLGAIYGMQGELKKAAECYQNSLGAESRAPEGYANLVNIYIAMEQYRDAEKWLQKGLSSIPNDSLLISMEKRLVSAQKK